MLIKIGLLVMLWLFIWMAVRALRKDTQIASGAAAGAVPAAIYGGESTGQSSGRSFGLRKKNAPTSLTVTSGPLAGTYLDFAGYSEITIGRSSTSTLVLEDDFASGSHARLTLHGKDWFVEDLDSRNGTWINSQRIDQPEELYAGKEIRIGQTNVRMDS